MALLLKVGVVFNERGEHSRAVGGLAALSYVGALPVQAIISALALEFAPIDTILEATTPILPASPPTIKRGGTDRL